MPLLTIPAKAARLSASTSANAGSTPVSEDRAAAGQRHEAGRARPARRQPEQAADGQRVQPEHDQHDRDGHQHRRDHEQRVDLAAGRDALIAQHDQAGRAGRAGRDLGDRPAPAPSGVGPVSAVRIRAGLPAGAGLRCCQAAISGGPASAAATVIPASSQPSPEAAASPGITAMASGRADRRGGQGGDHGAARHQAP